MNKMTIGIGVLVIAIIAGIVLIILPGKTQAPTIGGTATSTQQNADIVVSNLVSGDTITSPVTITGEAKGNYYFEASFPIQIKDASGNVIGQGPAQAQSDWMTTDYVPFKATITFTAPPKGSNGSIVLKNDNPSGDPSKDKFFEVPVKF